MVIAALLVAVAAFVPGSSAAIAAQPSRVLAWGPNGRGEVGDGTTTARPDPVQLPGLTDIVEVDAGGQHSLALRADGRVLAWGWNRDGQLGDGTVDDRHSPVLVDGLTDVVDIEASGEISLAIRADGTVWQWGSRATELVATSLDDLLVPTQVAGLTASVIGAGVGHRLVGDAGGAAGWGFNRFGQLGDASTTDRWAPAPVSGVGSAIRVGGGFGHSVILQADGTVRSVGRNDVGQLGDGTTTERHESVPVGGLSGVTDLAVGDVHALALLADGTVKSWGEGAAGQLGHDDLASGAPAPRLVPGPVPGLTGVTDVIAGHFSSAAITADGLWTWGSSTGVSAKAPWGIPQLVPGTLGVTGAAIGGSHGLILLDGVPLDVPVPTPTVAPTPTATPTVAPTPTATPLPTPMPDATAPAGSVTIASGANTTRSRVVEVAVPAVDADSGVAEVALSDDGATWTVRPYASSQPWNLPVGDGLHTVLVKWRDTAGNWSAAASDSIILDTVAPTVTKPARRFVSGTGLDRGRIVVRSSWTGSDATSGIARYEVELSTDGGRWTSVSTALASRLIDRALAPQHDYRFRVRAIDVAGNASAWAAGSTFRIARYGDQNGALRYRGKWRSVTGTAFLGGTAMTSSQADARASITVTAGSVAWISRVGPDRGKAAVYVDGVRVATVDLSAGTYGKQRVVWAQRWAGVASRTVTIRVLGTPGRPRIDVDAFIAAS